MALVCPACGTENRAVAKFCIECIGALQPDFEATQVVSRRASSDSTTLMGMPTALAEFGSATPPSAPSPAPAATGPRRKGAAEPRKGLWLSVAAFAIVLMVGAGGWLIAGAGGWYLYTASTSAIPAAVNTPAVVEAALVALPPSAPPAAAQAAVVAPVGAAPLVAAPAAAPAAVAAAAARPTPLAKVRPAARDTVPRAAVVTDPAAACAALGFLAKARCMAAQCAKFEHRGHSACQSVLAQQRLMEEKRNPLLAN